MSFVVTFRENRFHKASVSHLPWQLKRVATADDDEVGLVELLDRMKRKPGRFAAAKE